MKNSDFVTTTVMSLDEEIFVSLKKILIGEYLSFSIIDADNINREILAEKLCDYFEKMELKTGKSFDKQVEAYTKDIDSIVSPRIIKTSKPDRKDPTPVIVHRARKYYEKALATKNSRNLSARNLVDYSRIMFCLYAAIVKAHYKEIADLDFSVKSIDVISTIESMKTEAETIAMVKKKRFDIKNLYCSDTCTFIMSIVLLHKIMNDRVRGEYYHE